MGAADTEGLLPEGTLLYREYEALMPGDTRVTVAVTLDDLWDDSPAATDARTNGAAAYGHILLVDAAKGEPAMVWTCDGEEARIIATPRMVDAMEGGLREAIGSFLLHFLAGLWQDLGAIEDEPPTVH